MMRSFKADMLCLCWCIFRWDEFLSWLSINDHALSQLLGHTLLCHTADSVALGSWIIETVHLFAHLKELFQVVHASCIVSRSVHSFSDQLWVTHVTQVRDWRCLTGHWSRGTTAWQLRANVFECFTLERVFGCIAAKLVQTCCIERLSELELLCAQLFKLLSWVMKFIWR